MKEMKGTFKGREKIRKAKLFDREKSAGIEK